MADQKSNICASTVGAAFDSYLSGEASAEERLAVERHIADCAPCAEELRGMERLRNALKQAVSTQAAPQSVRDAVHSAMAAEPVVVAAHTGTPTWLYAAAAVLLVAICSWFAVQYFTATTDESGIPGTAPALAGALTEQMREVLNVGLVDHVNCAIKYKQAERTYSPAQMSKALGPEYIGLVDIIGGSAEGYDVTFAHLCTFGGRKFVHFILKNGEQFLSVAITEKRAGDTFPEATYAEANAEGIPVYRVAIEKYEVAGFESDKFMVFAVSDFTKEENLKIAAVIAPHVSGFLNGVQPG